MTHAEYLNLVKEWRKHHSGTFTTIQVIKWAMSAGLISVCEGEARERLADELEQALRQRRSPDGNRQFLDVDLREVKNPLLRARIRGDHE
jgi:hypothetical protein